jgi:hypothetical protein
MTAFRDLVMTLLIVVVLGPLVLRSFTATQ